MGFLIYGSSDRKIVMEDSLLAHVKTVIVAKLRRNESFLLSWQRPDATIEGRTSLWLHPSIPLQFEFDSSEPVQRDKGLLEDMMRSVSTSGDLFIHGEMHDIDRDAFGEIANYKIPASPAPSSSSGDSRGEHPAPARPRPSDRGASEH